jgi:hypothetical protein
LEDEIGRGLLVAGQPGQLRGLLDAGGGLGSRGRGGRAGLLTRLVGLAGGGLAGFVSRSFEKEFEHKVRSTSEINQ